MLMAEVQFCTRLRMLLSCKASHRQRGHPSEVVLEHRIQGVMVCMHAHGGGQIALHGALVLVACKVPKLAVSLGKSRVGRVLDGHERSTWSVCHMGGTHWAVGIVHERACSWACPPLMASWAFAGGCSRRKQGCCSTLPSNKPTNERAQSTEQPDEMHRHSPKEHPCRWAPLVKVALGVGDP